MGSIRIHQEQSETAGGFITASATIERPNGPPSALWFKLPERWSEALSPTLDPFAVGAVFTAMREGLDIKLAGQVSPSLLYNIEEFIAVWAHWMPEKYRQITIYADMEREPELNASRPAVVAFSGGIDAAFTVYRHRNKFAGRRSENVRAGVLAHGFDIPLEEDAMFEAASHKAQLMLESLGLELIPVRTNFRELGGNWNETHGAGVACCLMILQGGFSAGLIGSTEPYRSLILPWGSNPITDPLLGSMAFRIVHDGAEFTRSAKTCVISAWPEAHRYLRVCWSGKFKDRNCGKCEKCIRTILNFRLAGDSLPACFDEDISDRDILRLKGLTPVPIAYLQEILDSAVAAGIGDSWVGALRLTIKRNRRAATGWRNNLRNMRNELGLRKHIGRIIQRR